MEVMLQKLESKKVEFEHSLYIHLKTSISNAWIICDKYYTLTEDSPVYIAALVLNSELKWLFLEERWQHRSNWIVAAKAAVSDLWNLKYAVIILPEQEPEPVMRDD